MHHQHPQGLRGLRIIVRGKPPVAQARKKLNIVKNGYLDGQRESRVHHAMRGKDR
jgi:hypothetical protein